MARVIPQLYDLTGEVLGPLTNAGKIIASHVADLCSGLDLDESHVSSSQEVADIAEKNLAMLCVFTQEELNKIVITMHGGQHAYVYCVFFILKTTNDNG